MTAPQTAFETRHSRAAQAQAIAWAAMGRTSKHLGRVVPNGKTWKIDFGRKYNKRYLYSFRGVSFEDEPRATAPGVLARGVLAAIELEHAKGQKSLDDILAEYGPPGSSADIQRWLAKWMRYVRKATKAGDLSLRTLREYSRWAREEPQRANPENHFSWWYGRSIYEATRGNLRTWSLDLADRGLKGKTRCNVMSGFSSFLRFVDEHVDGFELPRFPWPEKDEHVPRLISLELRDKVLAEIPEDRRGIFLAMAWSGTRPSEVRVLRVKDWQGLELDVSEAAKTRKTGRGSVGGTKKRRAKKRRGIADQGAGRALLDWIEKHVTAERRIADPDGPLFVNPYAVNDGQWWSCTAIYSAWWRAAKKVGVEVAPYEGTKHSLGTAMKAAGMDDRVIAEVFGHSDPRSVLPYAKVQTEVARTALGRIGKKEG